MKKNILALDFGGTKLTSAIVDVETGLILNCYRAKVETGWGAKEAISKMIEMAKKLTVGLNIVHVYAVGISFGGPISSDGTKVLKSQHISGWSNLPLVKIIQDEFNLPVFLGNDANVAALGEWKFGSGKDSRVMLYIQISTGIGAGIILNGKIFTGCGLAGEFGHMTVENGGLTCACGKRGCLESYSAGWAISKRGKEEYRELYKHSTMLDLSENNLNNIDARLIFKAYRKNDDIAKKIVSKSMEYFGIAISHAICLFDPDRIVLGGGISKAKDVIKKELFPVVSSNTPPDFKNRYEINFSSLKGYETLIGAALLAK